jgi:hypothetical protein
LTAKFVTYQSIFGGVMVIKILLVFFLLITLNLIYADKFDEIMGNKNLHFGLGEHIDYQEARKVALKNLSESISVTVKSLVENRQIEKDGSYSEQIQTLLNTISQTKLQNLHELTDLKKDGKVRVMLFISKEELEEIYEMRKKLIYYMYEAAREEEKNNYLGTALKQYYHTTILIRSLPVELVFYNQVILENEIPRRIRNILNETKLSVYDDKIVADKRIITLQAFRNNQKVNNLDFTYWDGINFQSSNITDGFGKIVFCGSSVYLNDINLSVEYKYENHRTESKLVHEFWDHVIKIDFAEINRQKVTLANLAEKEKAEKKEIQKSNIQEKKGEKKETLTLSGAENCPYSEEIYRQTCAFLIAINQGIAFKADSYVLPKYNKLMELNSFHVIEEAVEANINQTANGWEVRQIPVLCSYPKLRKTSNEYLVLDFDAEGELYDINFATYQSLYHDFIKESNYANDWKQRQVILKFLEKYRTAYLGRDIKMLDKIFDDKARIIIGRILPESEKRKDISLSNMNERQVRYLTLTKEDFLKRQEIIFAEKQDIHLGFSTMKIEAHQNYDDVYGISLRQSYCSSLYSDEGYLFLLVDFSNDEPTIHIRSWQPQEWERDKLIKFSNFKIYK